MGEIVVLGRRLGKLPARFDTRTLKLSNYTKALPPPPVSTDFASKITTWPMMGNDSVGDCTCAAAGHMVEQWSTYSGSVIIPSDLDVLTMYSAVTGYDPADPSTDQGANMLGILKYWRSTGMGTDKIAAFASIRITDLEEVKQAISLFGNCYMGVSLPVSAQGQNDLWDVVPNDASGDSDAGSWGGHCIPLVSYKSGRLGLVTWGKYIEMTEAFYLQYVEEAYAVLSSDWFGSDGAAPSGFDLGQLQQDLAEVV